MNTNSRSLRSRLTYANVMATIAVFIALGGSSYAAVKVNGKDIKKNTIAGKALKKDTLTGREIKESKLGKVPTAGSADAAISALTAGTAGFATRAGAADSVGGATVTPISKTATPGTPAVKTTLFTHGAWRIEGECLAANDFPELRAYSSADDGIVTSTYSTSGSSASTVTFSGAVPAGGSAGLDNSVIAFSTSYHVTLRNADGTAATVIISGIKSTSVDGVKCRYTGVGFGF